MKYILSLALLCTALLRSNAQTAFYDISAIQEINITFNQANWDYQMDTAATGAEGYIIAAQVVINGTAFDSVGVKYKGNSSYNANNVKNPLHIKLDYVKNGADYQGFDDIKLSNLFKDPSFLREPLSYEILRNYMHAPNSNYARVKINGSYVGLFVNTEDVGNRFTREHFYSEKNAFFKCNPIGGAGPGGGQYPSLVYLGSDSSLYQTAYELQSTYGWNELVTFIDSLNNNPSSIISSLDVDRVLWMHAFNNLFVNLDSYTGGFSQNYYLYKDENRRFNPVVWDLNESFGAFPNSGSGNLTVTQMQQMSPVLHETNTAKPLIQKLLADPEYKRRYLAHMRTMMNEFFVNSNYVTRAQQLQTIVDSSVQADVNKFYTYTNFQNGLTTSVGGGPGSTIPGIQQLMSARATWLQSQSQFTAAAPSITNVTPSATNPGYNTSVTITCNVSNGGTVKLGYRDAVWKKFNYAVMYDDGAHNDGGAGDGVYGASFVVTSTEMQYYVYAENANAGMFSPERAEHEFYTITANIAVAAAGQVNLNEFQADNVNDTTDASGVHEDWIELYNNTGDLLSLYGLYLSDDPTQLTKWAFPQGTTIAPYSTLLIWADEDNSTGNELHCNFKLNLAGEQILLSNANGNTYDLYIFGQQVTDYSFRRCPNGIGPWGPTTNTTPAYANYCPTGLPETAESGITLFPNPADQQLQLISQLPLHSVKITDITGREVMVAALEGVTEWQIATGGFNQGIYFVFADGIMRGKFVVKH